LVTATPCASGRIQKRRPQGADIGDDPAFSYAPRVTACWWSTLAAAAIAGSSGPIEAAEAVVFSNWRLLVACAC
jgi:hypothetical protein